MVIVPTMNGGSYNYVCYSISSPGSGKHCLQRRKLEIFAVHSFCFVSRKRQLDLISSVIMASMRMFFSISR